MSIEVVLPRLGWDMQEGSLVEWRKQDGDLVQVGDVICLIEGDKAVSEVEAMDAGILRIPPDAPAPGIKVPVGTLLAYLDETGDIQPLVAARPSGESRPAWSAEARTVVSPVRVATSDAPSAEPDRDGLLALYRQMVQIRRCEEQLARSHQAGLIHGACHTYVGEEAVASGVCAHLRIDDVVLSTHRGHGHALAKGVSPAALIAELFGRATGCSHGRGGSMHLFSPEVGMLGTSGIVGPSILMATGAAYAFRLKRLDRVSVAFFGDGASNNGAFHEGLNLAAIWKLPVLFVCENNQYATEVPFVTIAGNPNVAERGQAYGLPSYRVDGNDVLNVYQRAGQAIQRARAGDGPTLLECFTYRTRAHSEGMRDAGYRSREEVEEWRARDPIRRLREHIVASERASEDELNQIEADVQRQVEAALEFAKNSPWPDPSTATDHIYSEDEHA
ncbi:MAG TPA: thiamine pyrophosphate-dependent enzyme [Chloroflexota bacterium]|nr:thiamine pyrophosphate-dependent enzyme [Chloroflexota bacterium]